MSNFATQGGNAASSDNALAVSGSDNNVIAKEGIALGNNAKLNSGLEFGANSGTITIGETGLGVTFANTVKQLTEQSTAALASLAGSSNMPDPSADLRSVTDQDATFPASDRLWLKLGLALSVISILLFFYRRK